MISYLPPIYPDELVYSWVCRYYVHSGSFTHKMALDDILFNRHNNPSKEFIGHLNPEFRKTIEAHYSFKKLVLDHTMFPQYARFIPLIKKKEALQRLCYDFCDAHQLFAILPRTDNDRFLKYCPLCAKEDRQKYGETYWHRVHQIRNMRICTKHRCLLECSTVSAISSKVYTLCPSEDYIPNQEPQLVNNDLLLSFSVYLTDIFNAPLDFETDIPLSSVFYYTMKETRYISSGKLRFTKQLSEDIHDFDLTIGICDIASFSQIQKTLHGSGFDFSIVCQIAFYLKMSIRDLILLNLTTEQIQKEKAIHYTKDQIPNWNTFDEETFPFLEERVKEIYYGTSDKRPERVSKRILYREFNLSDHRLERLPKCRTIFDRYTETYEENWARRIIWAYKKLKAEYGDSPFYWSDIRSIVGVKRINVDKVIPFIAKHTDNDTYIAILQLIKT